MTMLPLAPNVAKAIILLFDRDLPLVEGHPEHLGGNAPKHVNPLYIEVTRVPGAASTQTGLQVLIDVDCYARTYDAADSAASATEALLLGYPHVVEVDEQIVVLDRVEQNVGPAERPWQDDSVTRIGASYVITARRR